MPHLHALLFDLSSTGPLPQVKTVKEDKAEVLKMNMEVNEKDSQQIMPHLHALLFDLSSTGPLPQVKTVKEDKAEVLKMNMEVNEKDSLQRRLGTIRLQQFGIGSSLAPGSRCTTPRAPTPRLLTPIPISPARSSTRLTSNEPDPVSESSNDQFYEAGEDRQPRKKKRKQVITSDEEEEDDSSTPPPSNQPSTSDGRVREADKYGMDKYARLTPTLELASDKRRRK
ncbi:hypothetical protein CAEBREN_02560 [Caenorhabditis brenneri]|uniref:Uncharacterized protein n=1 Tax=Caenorhabditis brenneri TaxID=135651 RepID=G0NKC6_CAEBE|nr:hypothetical protein CAEBREN_02560 [Caenorhabditis brenneri]